MFYRIENNLAVLLLALLISGNLSEAKAQGVVSLGNEIKSEDNTLNLAIPNEDAIFGDDGNSANAKPKSVKNIDGPLPLPASITGAKPVADNKKPSGDGPLPLPASITGGANSKSSDGPLPLPASITGKASNALDIPEPFMPKASSNLGKLGATQPSTLTSDDLLNDPIFSQASDLEKQTTLLNLELRKEKVKNEIEAIKKQRQQAIEDEKDKQAAKEKAKIEWEKAQEQKVIQEQQKLRELDIDFEKLRQERLLNAYKNKMLEEHQKWVVLNGEMLEQLDNMKKDQKDVISDAKNKLENIKNMANLAKIKIAEAKGEYKREISDLQTQVSILKARIDAQEKELQARELEKQNPFAEGAENPEAAEVPEENIVEEIEVPEAQLSDMYAVMEIRGQGGELIAKIMNQNGANFFVKKGTALQSGHIIDEIQPTYVTATKNGIKDYLYFSAGGIVPLEPKQDLTSINKVSDVSSDEMPEEGEARSFVTSDGVPGLGGQMIGR